MSHRFALRLLCLAVEVLYVAAYRSATQRVDTTEVRLALRVVAAFIGDHPALRSYWQRASKEPDAPWETCTTFHGRIVDALIDAGWDVADDRVPGYAWQMCNRYRMTARQRELAIRYGIEPTYPEDESYPPPDLFPKSTAHVVALGSHTPGRRWIAASWGMPREMKGARGQPVTSRVTNVRNLDSPFWRSTLASREYRCLVPVTAFSEYGPGEKGKRPLFWFDVPSRPIFSFAGVWRPCGKDVAFAFLTTEPNAVVAPVHPKAMPVILHEEDEAAWLEEGYLTLVAPYPSQLMRVTGPPALEVQPAALDLGT